MESVGRLAGGIAHDFNNLLTSILGFTDMVLLGDSMSDESREDLDEVKRSAIRAKELTGQLLAYSRKQVIKPEVLDVGRQVQGTEKMLRRLIGEHIELVSTYPPEPATVEIDPGQLEQLLTNLVVNARDAMPRGGSLAIEIGIVELTESPSPGESFDPGDYVRLAIRDTGTGMDAETRSQIFEPFFTTKEVDRGTGLGLSTVYGIVSQNAGLVTVDTELGLGTTFNVYLPLAVDESPDSTPELDPQLAEGRGTVLVAEDQTSVRRFVKRTLERCGYKVMAAEDGRTAIEIAREHSGSIDLLLTDIVMPGVTGPEAAQMILTSRPDMRVVYMSAYPFDALGQHMVVDDSTVYLEKPFEAGALATLVQDVLAMSAAEAPRRNTMDRPSRSGVGS
jgi:CheY-like chemotaxis protein